MELNTQFTERFLFIDTEGTGFPKKSQNIQDGQARVCQVGLILTDAVGNSLSEFSAYVKPDGWKISDGAREVHGITDDHCEAHGIPMSHIIPVYYSLAQMADKIIAHGITYDERMMQIEESYFHRDDEQGIRLNKNWYCTMANNKHLNNGKYASLELCLQHYCGRSVGDGAHNAVADVQALRDIFFAMRGIKL